MLPLGWNRTISAVGLIVSLLLLNPFGSVSLATDRPDFVVTSVSDGPASALPGDTFTLNVVVTNQGTAPANATASLTQIQTKFFLVSGTTKKNLKGVDLVDLPVAVGQSITHNGIVVSVYSDTLPGDYTLQACADGGGDVSEGDESNNCNSPVSGGAITIAQAPDLIISSISNPSPSTAGQGQPITAKDTVKNASSVDGLHQTLTKYYLVSTIDGSRTGLKLPSPNVLVPALKHGQTFTEAHTVTIDPETIPGVYQLEACADGGRAEAETDENDNCATSSGKITVTAVPNLKVTSVSVQGAPLTVAPGDSLAITAVVANPNQAAAKTSTMKFALVDPVSGNWVKNLNGNQSTPAVNAGSSVTVQQTVTVFSDTLSGTYLVQACADAPKPGVIIETLESDNCGNSTAAVTVHGVTASNANLVVTSVTPPLTNAFPGDTFSVTALVQNKGTDPAPASTTSFILTNTKTGAKKNLKGGQSVPALAPGESQGPVATISVYSDTLPGIYTMQACADGAKAIAESSESDNCANATGTLTVNAVPNLIVSSISNPPSAAALGGTFNATDQVKNTSSADAGATHTKFYLLSAADGKTRKDMKGSQAVPQLIGGHTFSSPTSVTVRDDTVTGTYRLQACANATATDNVTESSEDDNCLTSSGTIHITGKPDLTVTSVAIQNAPLTVVRGGAVTITTDLLNQGEGDAIAVTLKYFLVDGSGAAVTNLNGTQAVSALRSGAGTSYKKTVTVFTSTPVGTYNVQACVDSTDVVDEASETNNCLTTSTTVTVQ